MRIMKRSICASGRGKVPSYSMGFCVAKHQEGRGHGIGDAVHRHLALFHGLEQRGLGLGRGAVDLVGEDDLRHDGAGPKLEFQRLLVEDADAGDVAGQHVGRELDAAEGAADAAGDGAGEHRLADAGHVLDQQVAFTEKTDQA